jgi:hypothetical protein
MRGFKMRLRDKAVFAIRRYVEVGAEACFCGAFAIGDRIAGGVWGADFA